MPDFIRAADRYFSQSLMTPARVVGTDDREQVEQLLRPIGHMLKLGANGAATERDSGIDRARDALEKVVGVDDRVKQGDLEVKLYPWIRICRIRMRCPDENGAPSSETCLGTGWFAGPKTIVTAGHVVFDREWGNRTLAKPVWGAAADIWVGYNEGYFLAHALSTNFRTSSAWRDYLENPNPDPDQQRFQVDIGCIQLSEPLADVPKFFDLDSPADAQLATHIATTSGFPADRDDGQVQYRGSGPITQILPGTFYHEVDTFNGQSGAPVWLGDHKVEQPVVVGIHTGGDENERRNWAVRVTPAVKNLIQQWVSENP